VTRGARGGILEEMQLPHARVRSASSMRVFAGTALGTADPLNPTVIMLAEAALCALVAILQHLPSSRGAPSNSLWVVAGAWAGLAVGLSVIRLAGATAFGARRRHVEKDGDLFTALLLIAALFAISLAVGALS
jgi:hypothetical protein